MKRSFTLHDLDGQTDPVQFCVSLQCWKLLEEYTRREIPNTKSVEENRAKIMTQDNVDEAWRARRLETDRHAVAVSVEMGDQRLAQTLIRRLVPQLEHDVDVLTVVNTLAEVGAVQIVLDLLDEAAATLARLEQVEGQVAADRPQSAFIGYGFPTDEPRWKDILGLTDCIFCSPSGLLAMARGDYTTAHATWNRLAQLTASPSPKSVPLLGSLANLLADVVVAPNSTGEAAPDDSTSKAWLATFAGPILNNRTAASVYLLGTESASDPGASPPSGGALRHAQEVLVELARRTAFAAPVVGNWATLAEAVAEDAVPAKQKLLAEMARVMDAPPAAVLRLA
ncbi:hypothetical protein GGF32_001483 [Allomyces javanicus]|nr:hypothetical protein GGF32_001483 [Allomyces javanicus]